MKFWMGSLQGFSNWHAMQLDVAFISPWMGVFGIQPHVSHRAMHFYVLNFTLQSGGFSSGTLIVVDYPSGANYSRVGGGAAFAEWRKGPLDQE